MYVGLISDTHGVFSDGFRKFLEPVDVIWHAGDFGGGIAFADSIAAFKPLVGVCGNCDGGDLRLMFPEKLRWTCEGADILMTHIGGYPGRYDRGIVNQLYTNPPALFICGHSHILKVQYDQRLHFLHINPGAAGLQGWHRVRTLVRFTVDAAQFCDLEVIELGRPRDIS